MQIIKLKKWQLSLLVFLVIAILCTFTWYIAIIFRDKAVYNNLKSDSFVHEKTRE